MEFLLDPNIAYVLLASGLVLAVLALLSPGTGLLEVGALFLLFLAGWGVYNRPFNWWALIFIAAGVVLFVISVKKAKQWAFLVVSILALVIGSAFLFRGEQWWAPAVNPFLAALVSILSAGFFWIAARKTLEATGAQPTHNLTALVGAIGEAKTDIHEEGSVQVAGELWSAHSQKPIPNGAQVRVVQREGFILEVEAVD
jgi:membrane-bound serine protease (ClpP class)